jgi:hypothetical protein
MPIKEHSSNGKYYYQYGDNGTKYYFKKNNDKSREHAYDKALKQSQAIHANAWAAGLY